jgi:hypothetical protein
MGYLDRTTKDPLAQCTPSTGSHPSQNGMILTDDVSLGPVLDFNAYGDTIVNIIKILNFLWAFMVNGVLERPTLMDVTRMKLKSASNILIVWFDAYGV